jgi:hypothetical protein
VGSGFRRVVRLVGAGSGELFPLRLLDRLAGCLGCSNRFVMLLAVFPVRLGLALVVAFLGVAFFLAMKGYILSGNCVINSYLVGGGN